MNNIFKNNYFTGAHWIWDDSFELAIIILSEKREWNNCSIKNKLETLLDPNGRYFSVMYKGSYTMAAKPMKSLELHYAMIHFLII